MNSDAKRITRSELCEQVLTDPMTKLAKRNTLSKVGYAKIYHTAILWIASS